MKIKKPVYGLLMAFEQNKIHKIKRYKYSNKMYFIKKISSSNKIGISYNWKSIDYVRMSFRMECTYRGNNAYFNKKVSIKKSVGGSDNHIILESESCAINVMKIT